MQIKVTGEAGTVLVELGDEVAFRMPAGDAYAFARQLIGAAIDARVPGADASLDQFAAMNPWLSLDPRRDPL